MLNIMKHQKTDNYVHNLQEEMNKLIESVFTDFNVPEKNIENMKQIWRPSVEISESGNKYKVKAQLPGLDKNDINIELGEDYLTIKGRKEYKKETEKENLYKSEFSYGEFLRTISFPTKIDVEKSEANYKHGVLTVNVEKVLSKESTKQIEIKE